MTKILERAGALFLRAFGTSFLFYSTGILASPNLEGALALAVSAGSASLAAGLRALGDLIATIGGPDITFKHWLGDVWGSRADIFTMTALGNFIAGAATWFAAPDLATWRVAWVAIFVGAASAGARALQGLFTKGEYPAPERGLAAKTA